MIRQIASNLIIFRELPVTLKTNNFLLARNQTQAAHE
jgi:hypothetical protein